MVPLRMAGWSRSSRPSGPRQEMAERFGLTQAESRVARQIARGRSNREIARDLLISEHTARRHTERVMGKVGAATRAAVGARITG